MNRLLKSTFPKDAMVSEEVRQVVLDMSLLNNAK